MRDVPTTAPAGAPINLAAVADFSLGPLRVQPSLRRVSTERRQATVEPRVMQALVALAEAAATVVSRDELIDRCWQGRIVGDDAINRCIAKVRKLADISEPPAFRIETVSKVGYRLQALPASACVPAAAATPPATAFGQAAGLPRRSTVRSGNRLLWTTFALAVAAAASAIAFRQARPSPKWTVQTSHPMRLSDAGEESPSISPNGSMLAYVDDGVRDLGRIFVKNLLGGAPMPASAADENADAPAWAPDGVHLAYVVLGPSGAPCRIMVTTFPGGHPTLAGRCRHADASQIAWDPSATGLFFMDEQQPLSSDAIFRLDLRSGDAQQLSEPTMSESDGAPRVSPNGEWLAYIRFRGFAGSALRIRKIAGGGERELACEPNVTAVDWSPDSRTLIAVARGRMGGEILAYPIDGASAYRVYATAAHLLGIAAGPRGLLATDVYDERRALARASATKRAAADVIDHAPGETDWPAFAADGTLAFVSSRSGEIALWVRKPGHEPVEIFNAGAADIERPVWSPDGTRIAFFQPGQASSTGDTNGNITVRVLTAEGEQIVSFNVPSIGFGMPNWTPDGEHLVMFDKRILRAVRIDLRDPARREPVADSLWDAITYRNGNTYSARAAEPGIWQLNGGPRLITSHYPAARQPRLAFKDDNALLPDATDTAIPGGPAHDVNDPAIRSILAQPLSGGPSHIAYYTPQAEPGSPFAVDPLSGDVIYVTQVTANSHIDLHTIVPQ